MYLLVFRWNRCDNLNKILIRCYHSTREKQYLVPSYNLLSSVFPSRVWKYAISNDFIILQIFLSNYIIRFLISKNDIIWEKYTTGNETNNYGCQIWQQNISTRCRISAFTVKARVAENFIGSKIFVWMQMACLIKKK